MAVSKRTMGRWLIAVGAIIFPVDMGLVYLFFRISEEIYPTLILTAFLTALSAILIGTGLAALASEED